jgi:hypothetical protein
MITDDAMKQAVYQHILKTAQRRLEQTVPGSSQGTFAHLSSWFIESAVPAQR